MYPCEADLGTPIRWPHLLEAQAVTLDAIRAFLGENGLM